MDTTTYQKRAKILFRLWVISYIIYNVISNIYYLHQQNIMFNNPIVLLSKYQVLSLVIMIAYFLPLLITVFHYSKLADMLRFHSIVRFILIFFSIWLMLMVLFTILAIFIPEVR